MYRLLLVASLVVTPLAASAQEAQSGTPPQRIRNIQLKPGEACPKANGSGEVVVCGTLEEPYRLPKQLRQQPVPPAHESWVKRAETVDDVSRRAGGLPDTCSAIGTGGATGCTQQMIQAWGAERRAAAAANTPAATGK